MLLTLYNSPMLRVFVFFFIVIFAVRLIREVFIWLYTRKVFLHLEKMERKQQTARLIEQQKNWIKAGYRNNKDPYTIAYEISNFDTKGHRRRVTDYREEWMEE